MINISESEFPYLRAMPGETYRRIGVPGCRRLQSVIQLRRDLLIIIAMSKSSLASPDAVPPTRRYADTPTRRYADTFPLASDNAYQFYQPIGQLLPQHQHATC